MLRELKCLGERTVITLGADRRKFTPWGLEGGNHAHGSQAWVISPDGKRRELPTKAHTVLHKGECLVTQTPGGGDWGDPIQREHEKVAKDVEEGLIDPTRAAEIYGLRRSSLS